MTRTSTTLVVDTCTTFSLVVGAHTVWLICSTGSLITAYTWHTSEPVGTRDTAAKSYRAISIVCPGGTRITQGQSVEPQAVSWVTILARYWDAALSSTSGVDTQSSGGACATEIAKAPNDNQYTSRPYLQAGVFIFQVNQFSDTQNVLCIKHAPPHQILKRVIPFS